MAQAGIIEAGAMIDTLNFALDRAAIIPLYFVFFGLWPGLFPGETFIPMHEKMHATTSSSA